MILDRTKGARRPGRETDGTNGTPSPPGGRLTLIDQVLMQIKDEEALTYPGKLKGDPNRCLKDKYCRFHRNHSHDTADCYDLKQQIEALIKQGKLQRFVKKERADQPPQE